jgi:hypothetical protein
VTFLLPMEVALVGAVLLTIPSAIIILVNEL